MYTAEQTKCRDDVLSADEWQQGRDISNETVWAIYGC